MKKILLFIFIVPILIFAHIKDERLFKTPDVPASALILLDRSGSMAEETYSYYEVIRLNDYASWDHRERITGWYDSEIIPDGPGTMSSFNGFSANGFWILHLEWNDYRYNRLDLNWTLKIKISGWWYTYEGGSHSWTGYYSEEHEDTINVEGLGIVEDVECYVDISTFWGLEIGEMRVNLLHTPGYNKSSRIKDAILVIHSLLDANNNGFVTDNDEYYLPINLGYGFHRESRVYTPGNNRYTEELMCETYNEETEQWQRVVEEPGRLFTDTIGSRFLDIWNHINYTDVGGYTPNGVLIARSVDYLNDWKEEHEDLWCMKHNLILITDGQTNRPREECDDGSKDVVRQAYKAWSNNGVRVYAVGFGTDITEGGANELNWIARWGGTQKEDSAFIDSMVTIEGMDTTVIDPRNGCSVESPQDRFLSGYAYIAEDAEALSSALARIFMEIVGQKNQSFAASEITSVQEEFISTQYKSRIYFASFVPDTLPLWDGDLRAIRLDTGKFNLDSIPAEIILWSAGDSLQVDKNADERNIYGVKSSGRMLPFNENNFDKNDFDVSSSSVASNIIERIRDGLYDDNRGELGDIFHSSPLRIHFPNYFYVDQAYYEFYENVIDRSPLIYAGGNDGMLHVFADSVIGTSGRGGEEIAGIIPMNFIPELKTLLYKHDYFVDADPAAADVWLPTDADDSVKAWDEWHTILIATQGEGGKSFTVLDVTDPLGETQHPVSSIEFLFSAIQSNVLKDTLGFTTSTPMIHKVGVNWDGHGDRKIDRFFAFMGGGQFPDPMDISLLDSIFSGGEVDGNVIVAFDIWESRENGINGNVYLIPAITRDAHLMEAPFPASPTVFNMDPEFGNRSDFLFIPDAFGQLWVVDLREPNPLNWRAECIFRPEVPSSSDSAEIVNWHPAFYRPLVWKDPVYGEYWIAYGTGNRSDIFTESEDRFYALRYPSQNIEDPEIAIPMYGEGDLGTPGIPTGAGWMHILPHESEKVVTQGIYFLDSIKFFTFTPGEGEASLSPCEIGGAGSIARSYSFYIRTGETNVIGGVVEGSGLPQPSRYSYSLDGTGLEINQVSGEISVSEIRKFKSFKEIVRWKEE